MHGQVRQTRACSPHHMRIIHLELHSYKSLPMKPPFITISTVLPHSDYVVSLSSFFFHAWCCASARLIAESLFILKINPSRFYMNGYPTGMHMPFGHIIMPSRSRQGYDGSSTSQALELLFAI